MKQPFDFKSDRDRIRTCDRLLRRQMLYPAELLDQYVTASFNSLRIAKLPVPRTNESGSYSIVS